MDIADVEQLIDIIRDAQVSELAVSTGTPQTTIRLRKPACTGTARPAGGRIAHSSAANVRSVSVPHAADKEETPAELHITAPMVGIFHAIESMTTVGSPVKAGQVVGSIESMKLMNDVRSKHDGVVAEMLVEDGMAVEYGQSLFVLTPSASN